MAHPPTPCAPPCSATSGSCVAQMQCRSIKNNYKQAPLPHCACGVHNALECMRSWVQTTLTTSYAFCSCECMQCCHSLVASFLHVFMTLPCILQHVHAPLHGYTWLVVCGPLTVTCTAHNPHRSTLHVVRPEQTRSNYYSSSFLGQARACPCMQSMLGG
jgi:hypothetical protein